MTYLVCFYFVVSRGSCLSLSLKFEDPTACLNVLATYSYPLSERCYQYYMIGACPSLSSKPIRGMT